MEQQKGFKVKGKENLVYRLKKSLYGLKQPLQQLYKNFDSFMLDNGFKILNVDHYVYITSDENGNFIVLLLYVDDTLIIG